MRSIRWTLSGLIPRGTVPVCLALAACLALAPAALAVCGNGIVEAGEQCDDGSSCNGGSTNCNGLANSCCTATCQAAPKSPDVIVGQLVGDQYWGTSGGVSAYSIGTTSCNLGSCWLNWFSSTPEHPVIGQNMFRLKNGRFEHIGQSWLKHGFTALQGNVCPENGPCQTSESGGTHLGVNCSDPYGSGLNGDQGWLGPKWEVNAFTGVYPYPPTNGRCNGTAPQCRTIADCPGGQSCIKTGDNLYKRLQVRDADLDTTLNAGALYWVEGQYISRDDAAAKNGENNASYHRVTVSLATSPTRWELALTGSTQKQQAGLRAWKDTDASVTETDIGTIDDGMFILAAKATSLGGGIYHYEYALQNFNNHRSGQSFTVPIPLGAVVTNVGFHDVDYHSGEPYVGTDWTPTVSATSVSWATQTYAVNPNANALRWGTLYNFRFDANIAPATSAVTIGIFRPGTPSTVTANTVTPSACSATEVSCGNTTDDDCDGHSDCTDTDCCTNAACAGSDADGDTFAAVCDCNDGSSAVYPGAPQLCDGVNNNCSAPGWPAVPANEADADTDGARICGGDCDDADPLRFPGNPESCDGIDNDCAGGVPANEQDADSDTVRQCADDCNDANSLVWATPGEVRDVALSQAGGSTTVTWTAPVSSGSSAPRYDTLRSALPNDFVTGAVCVETDGTDTETIDSDVPAPGSAASYLVRCKNDCPIGEGSLGTDSNLVPRVGRSCP